MNWRVHDERWTFFQSFQRYLLYFSPLCLTNQWISPSKVITIKVYSARWHFQAQSCLISMFRRERFWFTDFMISILVKAAHTRWFLRWFHLKILLLTSSHTIYFSSNFTEEFSLIWRFFSLLFYYFSDIFIYLAPISVRLSQTLNIYLLKLYRFLFRVVWRRHF